MNPVPNESSPRYTPDFLSELRITVEKFAPENDKYRKYLLPSFEQDGQALLSPNQAEFLQLKERLIGYIPPLPQDSIDNYVKRKKLNQKIVEAVFGLTNYIGLLDSKITVVGTQKINELEAAVLDEAAMSHPDLAYRFGKLPPMC